jgi:hypothetical protein
MASMQIPQLDPITPARPFQLSSSRFDGSTGLRIIGPRDGKFVDLHSVGVRFMIWGAETGETFSLVEHPIPPRTLVAPLHLHQREDDSLSGWVVVPRAGKLGWRSSRGTGCSAASSATIRAKLREISERLGVRYVVNLAGCPAR